MRLSSGPVVKNPHLHYRGYNSIRGRGTKLLYTAYGDTGKRAKKKDLFLTWKIGK